MANEKLFTTNKNKTICLDCGDDDIRYSNYEKTYYCNNCNSRHIGTLEKGCGVTNCLFCSQKRKEVL